MELIEKIDTDMKEAMRAKDAARLRGLRGIKAALLNAKTEAGSGGKISPEGELKVLQKLAKQRREAADIYRQQQRPDLEKTELEELEVIENYLPQAMEPAELEAAVRTIIADTGAQSIKDMGRVMGVASKQLAGRADGKTISETVKRLLS